MNTVKKPLVIDVTAVNSSSSTTGGQEEPMNIFQKIYWYNGSKIWNAAFVIGKYVLLSLLVAALVWFGLTLLVWGANLFAIPFTVAMMAGFSLLMQTIMILLITLLIMAPFYIVAELASARR